MRNCACRDCFGCVCSDDADALCFACEDAGCEPNSETECCADGAYGTDDESEA